MPKKIIDKEGNEHEVITQEEINELINTKVEEVKSQQESDFNSKLNEKEEELLTLKQDLETAKEALDIADNGTKDWASIS